MTSRAHRLIALGAVTISVLAASSVGATTPAAPGTYALGLPTGALTTKQAATLTSVACATVNGCVAVGSFRTSAGNEPLVATEVDGTWATSATLALPSDAAASTALPPDPVTELLGVACPAVGDCVAVGTYQIGATAFAPMVATETNGTWSAATSVSLPASSLSPPLADLDAISCVSPGSCVAVGTVTVSGGSEEPWSISEVDGSWGTPVVPALPTDALSADQQAVLYSVSCASPSWCEAVGSYQSTSGVRALALTRASRTWGASATAVAVPLPADAASSDEADTALTSVTCPRVRTCAAVGNYATTGGAVAPMAALETAGTWATATAIVVPTLSGATGSLVAQLDAVSCTDITSCTAVGSYGTTSASAPDAASESGGSWSDAVAAPVPADHSAHGGYDIAGGVDCFTTMQCLSVGQYATAHGTEVYATVPATAPGPPGDLVAHFANQKVNLSWTAPTYTGLSPITGYTVFASPGGAQCTTTTLHCGVSGLTNGRLYTFTVTATNAAGTSAAAVVSATPATRPSAPSITATHALHGGVQIVIGAPARTGGGAIEAYEYSLTGAAPWRTPASDPARRIITVTGLARHHRYVVAVRAVNVAGPGPRSPRVVVTTT